MLRPLWLARRETICGRIQNLETSLRIGHPSGGFADARASAHQLRGLLGTFGFAEGTQLAGEAEELLKTDPPPLRERIEIADRLGLLRSELAGSSASAELGGSVPDC